MYDPRSEPREFIGLTHSDALAKACDFFGRKEEELRVAEIDPGTVSGLAARVVVVAVPRDAERPARGGGPAERGGGRARRREPRGEPREAREARERRGPHERPRRAEPAPAEAEPELEPEPSEGRALGELSEEGDYVKGIIERMGLGPFDVSESEEDGLAIVTISGKAAMGLSESDGRAADAIQLLANLAALQNADAEEPRRIVVDVEGDPEKRASFLEQLSERAASRAEKTGRTVALDPMNPRDRRTVHVALRDFEGIATMSTGSGRYRGVLVVPEGAPEYDEARQVAEDAASREED